MRVTVDSPPQVRRFTRVRPWLAVIVAAIIFALIPLVSLQLLFVVPLIGLTLAAGARRIM